MLEEAIQMLPTPRARVDKEYGPNGQHWGELNATVLSLLPTPTATEGGYNQSPSPGAAIRPTLETLVRLLPTPVKGDAKGSRQATAPNPRSPQDTLGDLEFRWSGMATNQPSGGGSRWSETAPEPLCFFRGMDARAAARVERSRLSALGDGVQVQLGELVGRYLMSLENAERVAA